MTLLAWRDPAFGKHHLSRDGQDALCGRTIPGFWESESTPKWADEDCCKTCARSTQATPEDPKQSKARLVGGEPA
jgi:hypothetical protein